MVVMRHASDLVRYHSGTSFQPIYKVTPNKNFREGRICEAPPRTRGGRLKAAHVLWFIAVP